MQQNRDLKQLITVLIEKGILDISTLPKPITFYYSSDDFVSEIPEYKTSLDNINSYKDDNNQTTCYLDIITVPIYAEKTFTTKIGTVTFYDYFTQPEYNNPNGIISEKVIFQFTKPENQGSITAECVYNNTEINYPNGDTLLNIIFGSNYYKNISDYNISIYTEPNNPLRTVTFVPIKDTVVGLN
jgi:hypothetical protein